MKTSGEYMEFYTEVISFPNLLKNNLIKVQNVFVNMDTKGVEDVFFSVSGI